MGQTEQIHRPRLIDAVGDARVVVAAAGSGWGKSALLTQLAEEPDVTAVHVQLRFDEVAPAHLLEAIRSGLHRAALDDAAEVVSATDTQPEGLADALHDGLVEVTDPCLFVIDDAHRLDAEAAGLLVASIDELPPPHRAAIGTRSLDGPLAELTAAPGAVGLVAEDLALTTDEVRELAGSHGIDLAPYDAEAIGRATDGWAAAVAMLAPTLDDPDAVEAACSEPATVGALTERLLAGLDEDARAIAIELAHLPLVDGALVDEVTGGLRVLDQLAGGGLPLTRARGGWWVIGDPVREALRDRGDLSARTAERAADVYERRGERRAALNTLLRAGRDAEAIARAGSWPNHIAMRLGVESLRRLCGSVDETALRTDLRVLIHLSRACGHANDVPGRLGALDRAEALVGDDQQMADEIEAERLLAEMWVGRVEESHTRAARLLERVGTDRPVVRAKALLAMARVWAWQRDVDSLTRADALMAEAMGIWTRLGEEAMCAQAAIVRGLLVSWPLGRHAEALAHLDAALSQARLRSRQRAQALPFKGFVLTYSGRHDEAARCFDEALHLGVRLRDPTVRLYARWGMARVASHRGHVDATTQALEAIVADAPTLIDTAGGAYLLADGAQLLDRVGNHALAWEWFAKAERIDDGKLGLVAFAGFALHARSGDPHAAESFLEKARGRPSVEPRDEWRVALLRAEAARRRGDAAAAHELAREAFALARADEVPDVAWVREPALAAQFAEMAGAPTSAASSDTRVRVHLLGAFSVQRGGDDLTPPTGRLAEVVKAVAVRGGRASVEQIITDLWPDAAPEVGRTRLRRVLARLRADVGSLLVRDGDALALQDGAVVDLQEFTVAARAALDIDEVSRERVRAALALAGPLLPEDSAAEWSIAPREEARHLEGALMDKLAQLADRAGDPEEAARLLEEAAALEPGHGDRLSRAADLLEDAGRAGRARLLRERRDASA